MRTFARIQPESETMQAPDRPDTSRRHVLRTSLCVASGLASGLSLQSAQAATTPFRIDVHAHLIPDFYRAALKAYDVPNDGGLPPPAWSPASAVRFMDKFGIQTQVVSLSEPGLAFLPDAHTRDQMARQINDYMRDALIGVPPSSPNFRRFGGFASMPLGALDDEQELALASQEARRAMLSLGLDGVGLYSSYRGIYLGDARLDPLMRTLNELGAMVFIHPVAPVAKPDLSIPNFVLEFPFETTRAVTNMLYKGIFLRYPRIRWLLAHAGGATPFLSYRSGLLALNLNPRQSAYGKLYFDTALSSSPAAMAATRQVTDVSHVLFGSDYPYAQIVYALKAPGDPNAELNDSFKPNERLQVDRGNALAQLPTVAKRLGIV
jgi:6-methylsalicylate decarboxylase